MDFKARPRSWDRNVCSPISWGQPIRCIANFEFIWSRTCRL